MFWNVLWLKIAFYPFNIITIAICGVYRLLIASKNFYLQCSELLLYFESRKNVNRIYFVAYKMFDQCVSLWRETKHYTKHRTETE